MQIKNENSIWFLENINVLFCPKKIANITEETNKLGFYKKGEYIYVPEEDADKIFFITKGRVKVGFTNDKNVEITKSILSKGEVFGELAVTSISSKRNDFAICLEDTQLCIVSNNELQQLLIDRNPIIKFLLEMVGSRLVKMENRLESLVFKDSKTRILEFLLETVESKGEQVGYEWVVRQFFTHKDIANMTGTSRQTVTTLLNKLRNDNLITFNRKRLLIRDLDALKSMV